MKILFFSFKMLRAYCLLNALSFRNCSSLAITIKETLKLKPVKQTLMLQGWVQAIRRHKDLYFIDLTDGTCGQRLQVIIETDSKGFPAYGSSIKVEGTLVESLHKGQTMELIAKSWQTIGHCSEEYPFLYRQKYTSEYIRQFAHLRPKTRSFGSTLRIRSCASFAVHKYFQEQGFHFIQTPIITLNDCEGAGEVFSVKVNESHSSNERFEVPEVSHNQLEKEDTGSEQLKELGVPKISHDQLENKDTVSEQVKDTSQNCNEFFNAPAYLTVSGQLHLEAMACALSRVYNFGPTFRAEISRSRQHASEFHMIEAEIAFTDTLEQLIKIVQELVQRIALYIMDKCEDDINQLCEKYTKNQKDYLTKLVSKPFVHMSYSEAISILESKRTSGSPIQWGNDLAAEHKEFLIKYCDKTPVFVSMFPTSLKPFYMKTSENETAHCFDLFAPFGGEICGGSLREDNEYNLKKNLPLLETNSSLSWYLDLRKYGSVPHGGFGIGFDRLLQTLLGISNIRDVIPFPRRKYDCQC